MSLLGSSQQQGGGKKGEVIGLCQRCFDIVTTGNRQYISITGENTGPWDIVCQTCFDKEQERRRRGKKETKTD